MESPLEAKDFALYNGVSNRSRGWKSRKPGESTEPQAVPVRHVGIKRWDGKSKTSMAWDGLRRDPELWFRNGNCFVHLYSRGQSRRGPAFKLPFSTLLAAQCHPLIERFVARDMPALSNASDLHNNTMLQQTNHAAPTPLPLATLDYCSRAHLLGRVDLYIPPPLEADKDEVYSYYLAIRNLFAWVFRRAVVGEHLGSTLAGLFSAMREFRQPSVDNAQDFMCYLEDEGYLAISGHPEYALALLHLAETMHLRDLYIDSFAHCVGMYNDLFLGVEYQYISAVSRKCIRRARLDMDLRLGSAGSMLCDFFEQELSETHLGLPTQSRAHLDRFRAFIHGYYTARLGYYPPLSIDTRSTIFEPPVYRLIANDFQALYEYLVDMSFLAGSTAPPLSQGGFCVLQTIRAFDARHKFTPLERPLSLLPEDSAQTPITSSPNTVSDSSGLLGVPGLKRGLSTRRMSWFGSKKMDKLLPARAEKLKPDARLVASRALLKATNRVQPAMAHNGFIAAYRQFEEDAVFKPYKADRVEKISLIEARKVRWILVYAIHQTLQNCFLPPPPEVHDADSVPYHVSISAKYIPEWKDGETGIQPSSSSTFSSPPVSPTSATLPSLRTLANSFTFPTTENMTPEPLTPTGRNRAPYNPQNNPIPPPARCMSMTALPDGQRLDNILMMSNRGSTASPVFDFRPDIDYLGLASRVEPASLDGEVEVVMLPRSRSLTRTLSQKTAFRRSLSLFRGNSNYSTDTELPSPVGSSRAKQTDTAGVNKSETSSSQSSFRSKRNSLLMRPSSKAEDKEKSSSLERKNSLYHEIVVHGYGNGTNPVQLTVTTSVADQQCRKHKEGTEEGASSLTPLDDSVTTPSTARSLSTSSTNSNTSAATAESALTTLSEATQISSISSIGSVGSGGSTGSTSPVSCPGVPRADSATDVVAHSGLSRSSSMYSSAPGSSMAVSRASSFVAAEAPAIPPRARPQPMPLAASVSRSSSVYSTVSMLDERQTPPPPLPARSSARHRRFSVYGGGDEYARLNSNLDALNAVGAAAPQRSSSTARFIAMVTEPKRQSAQTPSVLQKQPPAQLAQTQTQTQTQSQKQTLPQRWNSMRNTTSASHRPQSMYANHATAQGGQRFDMVQEALEAVRETMEQHQMMGSGSLQVSRTPSFVGGAALRCVHEDDELTMGSPAAGERRRSRTFSQPPLASRRSSFGIGGTGTGTGNDDDDDGMYMNVARRGQAPDEHPEWDKFASLGGHTVV